MKDNYFQCRARYLKELRKSYGTHYWRVRYFFYKMDFEFQKRFWLDFSYYRRLKYSNRKDWYNKFEINWLSDKIWERDPLSKARKVVK